MAKYFIAAVLLFKAIVIVANFYNDFDITWSNDHAKILDNGREIQLSLDKESGSAFQSKKEYLFGKYHMHIKLIPNNSAGTVTSFYLSSQGSNHDEIDFEFLGNISGEPYILHTNIYTDGFGNREQQFYLWFDPRATFHTYSVVWSPQLLILLVDNTPIRVFPNNEHLGVPYPNKQPMGVYSSVWDADNWATRGGLVKTDWSKAPFVASFRNFNVLQGSSNGTVQNISSCASTSTSNYTQTSGNQVTQCLNPTQQHRLRWVQKHCMIYNYCNDAKRFPQGFPPECRST
uniref:Xyloglucan endotransglucosylase/hydrolase n=1 Tax=Pinus tabuliformis TaxID=88731 RepID=A0A0K0M6T9_PINTB|nr:BSD4 [Pinus tabuliformis]